MTIYSPFFEAGDYGLEPRAFYMAAPLVLPEPSGVVAAYVFYYSDARSCVNLIDPDTHPLTVVGAPSYGRDRIGAVVNVDNHFATVDLSSTDTMTLYAVAGVVKPVNSAGKAVLISNYDGTAVGRRQGDELSFVAGFAYLTGRIDGDQLTVSAVAPNSRPLEVGASIEWTQDDAYSDTIVALGSGSGGVGTYTLSRGHGIVDDAMTDGGISMTGRVAVMWGISARSAASADIAMIGMAGETAGARGFFAATLSSAGGNSARVFKAVGGTLVEGMADRSTALRSPIADATPFLIGANPQGKGVDVQIDMVMIAHEAHSPEQIGANLAYLRGRYLANYYSVAPTW